MEEKKKGMKKNNTNTNTNTETESDTNTNTNTESDTNTSTGSETSTNTTTTTTTTTTSTNPTTTSTTKPLKKDSQMKETVGVVNPEALHKTIKRNIPQNKKPIVEISHSTPPSSTSPPSTPPGAASDAVQNASSTTPPPSTPPPSTPPPSTSLQAPPSTSPSTPPNSPLSTPPPSHSPPLPPVPALVIEEEEFCRRYKEVQDTFRKKESIGSALELISMNTEEYYALSVLKRHLHKILTTELLDGGEEDQLALTTSLLRRNPKSYNMWFHRRYIRLGSTADPKKKTAQDTDFLREMLRRDSRNFHCWAYINRLCTDSIELVSEQLKKNISNYSAYSALLHLGRGEEMNLELLKNYVFTDPEMGAPWVFLSALLEQQRFKETNAYAKVYADRLVVVLKDPGRTEVEVSLKEKDLPVVYSVEFRKNVPIFFEKDKYSLEDIKKLVVKTKRHPVVEIDLRAAVEETPPAFALEFYQRAKKTNPDCLLLLLEYFKGKKRRDVIDTLLEKDGGRTGIYQDLEKECEVFSSINLEYDRKHNKYLAQKADTESSPHS
ncbi:hypothetical protein NECID01_0451 [Nematocida sp. AWRm77]|nr:hypothetical protein NECID01_0451 [Nematocida sp. AWRm77]